MKKSELAKMIDHTILKADATVDQILTLCDQAKEYNFASVCINPVHVKLASKALLGTDVKICTVVGFPLGANTTAVKVFETEDAVKNGADEIDMVINITALKNEEYEYVCDEIKAVVKASKKAHVKVIIETCYLTKQEIIKVSHLVKEAKADFIKTSTGFGTSGAQVDDVKIMDKESGTDVLVKASGGIRDYKAAVAMVDAGASRLGVSAGIAIVEAAE